VHVSTLVGDYYQFDRGGQCLVGERGSESFGLGDVVTVQVARVDVDERKVDLELLSHSPIARKKPKKRKSKDQKKSASNNKKRPSSSTRGNSAKGTANKNRAPKNKASKTNSSPKKHSSKKQRRKG